ncbi:hypothetical protein D3C72_1587390 [compost metagenome]
MQVSALVAAGNAVESNQGIVLLGGAPQENESLLIVGTTKPGVLEDLIGPQAVFATIAGLAPEQWVTAVLLQGFAGSSKRFIGAALRR